MVATSSREAHGEGLTHVSEQLSLRLRMPWDGYDPRALTRGSKVISFVRKGTGRTVLEPITAQLELFPEGTSYGS